MIFTLDVLRARKGDCLMLHYGDVADPRLILIDGGPSQVYTPHLKPRIEAIRKKRKLTASKPLPVELLLLSHNDDDHVRGLLDLTRELRTAKNDGKSPLVQVQQCWHNSFDNIIGSTPDELQAQFQAAFKTNFGAASINGEFPADKTVDVPDADEETVISSLKVLASIAQGAQLRQDTEVLDIPLNVEFDGSLIVAQKAGDPIDLGDGLSVTVIGPLLPEIKALHKKHQAWLKELQKKGQTPDDVLAAYVDKSVPNLSSIVLLAEVDSKTMLLTGDARGDKVLKGLEFVGVIEKDGSLHVDVLKVPHHGSANNLDKDFFERITADHYVFSGDGEHGNPEREAIEMLAESRDENDDYTIHLTYPVAEIDVERKKDWEKEQAKETNRKKKNKNVKVRPDWSAEKHSLAGFFKKHPKIKAKLDIVDEAKPHFINLHGKFKL